MSRPTATTCSTDSAAAARAAATPELTELEVGQRFMSQFDLVSFVPDGHITLVTGKICVTYAVRPEGSGTRLVVRMHCGAPWIVARALALGDLVMMRKQLLTLKNLAEAEQRTRA
ncbi:hypothetical protein [Rhodococcus sp. MTM3W5.2]|uniref:hypothetical protein n=1 Tax=Rhodococcus sp. MTM3W5.2 TaxID=1805827 RepID=UPI0016730652|nr:hypothetical protein [Rhodococcus sp. MTM3W5.2]